MAVLIMTHTELWDAGYNDALEGVAPAMANDASYCAGYAAGEQTVSQNEQAHEVD